MTKKLPSTTGKLPALAAVAILVLLWQLAEKIGEKLRWQAFAPLCAAAAAIALARINIPAIWEMLQFAVTYYPA